MGDQGEGRKGAIRSVERVRAGSMQGPVPVLSKHAQVWDSWGEDGQSKNGWEVGASFRPCTGEDAVTCVGRRVRKCGMFDPHMPCPIPFPVIPSSRAMEMDGTDLHGRAIKMSYAQPKRS